MERQIIARKPYSANPADDYLEVVMAKVKSGGISHEFVTWVYNKQAKGFAHGNYHGTDFQAALRDFNKRGNI